MACEKWGQLSRAVTAGRCSLPVFLNQAVVVANQCLAELRGGLLNLPALRFLGRRVIERLVENPRSLGGNR